METKSEHVIKREKDKTPTSYIVMYAFGGVRIKLNWFLLRGAVRGVVCGVVRGLVRGAVRGVARGVKNDFTHHPTHQKKHENIDMTLRHHPRTPPHDTAPMKGTDERK